MKRVVALVSVLVLVGCSTPSERSKSPNGGDTTSATTQTTPTTQPSGAIDPVHSPPTQSAKPQGPVKSREHAIEIARGGWSDGKWDAVLVKDYVHPAKDETQKRDTWIVQRLHPGPNETIYVDALTGAPYMARQTEAPAPVALPKTEQGALDLVFQFWGSEADFEPFPRTIGTKEGQLLVGGPAPGAKLPTMFTTSASAAGQGSYEVKLTRRWQLNEKYFQTTWTFKVQPDGIVINAPKTGDELPSIK